MTKKEREKYFLIRRAKRIKLRQLAEHMDCSISWVSQLEQGKACFNEGNWNVYKEFIDVEEYK